MTKMAKPNGLFGVPINGFHPQMTAVPNTITPLQSHPIMGRSTHPSALHRRPRETCKRSSPSSCHRRSPLSPPPMTPVAAAFGGMVDDQSLSLASRIDAQTKKIVQKLQHDAREMDRSRRLLKKRVRKEARRRQSSSLSSNTGTMTSSSCISANVSDAGGKADFSSCDGSGPSSSRKKRRLTPKDKQRGNNFATCSSDDCTTSSLSGFDEKSFISNATSSSSSSARSTFLDLYSDVFLASEKPQFMATPGGRIVSWNDEFLSTTGLRKTQLRGCMTVHNLIDSRCHYVLNDLFELALRGDADRVDGAPSKLTPGPPPPLIVIADRNPPAAGGNPRGRRGGSGDMRQNLELRQVPATTDPTLYNISPNGGHSVSMSRSDSLPSDLSDGVDAIATDSIDAIGNGGKDEETRGKDESEMMYSSVTLPCIQFSQSTVPLYMTIVLMNDIDPSKRCFYCVMGPIQPQQLSASAPSGPDGAYKRLGNDLHSTLLEAQNGHSLTMESAQSRATLGVIHRISQETLASLI